MNLEPTMPADQPAPVSPDTPRSNRRTCALVLGVAFVSVLLVAGAVALLLGRSILASVHQVRGTTYYEQGKLDLAIPQFD